MRKIDKKKLLFGIFFVVIVGLMLGWVFFARNDFAEKNFVQISGEKIWVDLAVTPQERERGLSGRAALCADCGMLFVFEQEDTYSFWMKDMRFALDVLWIDGNKIAQIDRNVPFADGMDVVIRPKMAVDKVLEINAGGSDRLGIKEGDEIEF